MGKLGAGPAQGPLAGIALRAPCQVTVLRSECDVNLCFHAVPSNAIRVSAVSRPWTLAWTVGKLAGPAAGPRPAQGPLASDALRAHCQVTVPPQA